MKHLGALIFVCYGGENPGKTEEMEIEDSEKERKEGFILANSNLLHQMTCL